jgi:hypothetical protein
MASDCVRCKFIGFRASGYALLVKRYMVQDNLFYYSAKKLEYRIDSRFGHRHLQKKGRDEKRQG